MHNSSLTLWHLTLPLLVVLVLGEPSEPSAAVAPHGLVVVGGNVLDLGADRDAPEVGLAAVTGHQVAALVDGHRQLLHPEPRAEGALPVAVQAASRTVCPAKSSACSHRAARSAPLDQRS